MKWIMFGLIGFIILSGCIETKTCETIVQTNLTNGEITEYRCWNWHETHFLFQRTAYNQVEISCNLSCEAEKYGFID